MKRCLYALLPAAVLALAQPAIAQVPDSLGIVRNFPDAALRGVLSVSAHGVVHLNGNIVRTAPGFRLLSPQNTLIMVHTVHGQSFKANYLIEASTGTLLTAWILSESEAAQPRKGSDSASRNYRFEGETPAR